jgi:hypothetical protein
MATNYTVRIKPDIIDGDVSKVIASNGSDAPFQSGDILFDWQPIQVLKGTNKLVSISGYIMGQDGGVQVNSDIEFVFAKTVDGVAPTTLGEENGPQTACFELPLHFIGFAKVEGTSSATVGGEFGDYFTSNYGGANGGTLPLILAGEVDSGDNVGYDTIYVAAFCGGAIDFSTGVLKDGAESSDSATSLTTKTVDPRKAFNVGDTVYIHDVDTAIGTIASMTATNITLNAAIAGGTNIADEDEFVNATPVTCIFGFER